MPSAVTTQTGRDQRSISIRAALPDKQILIHGFVPGEISVRVSRTSIVPRDPGKRGELYDLLRVQRLPGEMGERLAKLLEHCPNVFGDVVDKVLEAASFAGVSCVEGNYLCSDRYYTFRFRGVREKSPRFVERDAIEGGREAYQMHPAADRPELLSYLRELDLQEIVFSSSGEHGPLDKMKIHFPRNLVDPRIDGYVTVTEECGDKSLLHSFWKTHGTGAEVIQEAIDTLDNSGMPAVRKYVAAFSFPDGYQMVKAPFRPKGGAREALLLRNREGDSVIRFHIHPQNPPRDYIFSGPAGDASFLMKNAWEKVPALLEPAHGWSKKRKVASEFFEQVKTEREFVGNRHPRVAELMNCLDQYESGFLSKACIAGEARDIGDPELHLATLLGFQVVEIGRPKVASPAHPSKLVLMLNERCEGMVCFLQDPFHNRTMFRFSEGGEQSVEDNQADLLGIISRFVCEDSYLLVQDLFSREQDIPIKYFAPDSWGEAPLPRFELEDSPVMSQQMEDAFLYAWDFFADFQNILKQVKLKNWGPGRVDPRVCADPLDADSPLDPCVKVVLRQDDDMKIIGRMRYDGVERYAPYVSTLDFQFADKEGHRAQFVFCEESISDRYIAQALMEALYIFEDSKKHRLFGISPRTRTLRTYQQFQRSALYQQMKDFEVMTD